LLRLFSICVPCLSSQPVEIDLPTPAEKSTIKTDDDHPTTIPVRPPTPNKDPLPTPPTEPVVAPLPVTPPQDDVLLPPTTPPPQLLPLSETEGVTSGAVQPPGSTGDSPVQPDKSPTRDSVLPSSASAEADDSESTSFTEDEDLDGLDDLEDDEEKLIMDGGAGIPIGPVSSSLPIMPGREQRTVTEHSSLCLQDGVPKPLLPPLSPQLAGRKCLILDLDETLVHSSFKVCRAISYLSTYHILLAVDTTS
jgi:RNA polymerase II subunit A small phosphatase-like protein